MEYVLKKKITGVPFAGESDYIIIFKNNSHNIWDMTKDNIPTNIKQSIIQVMDKLYEYHI